jgi:hypothetical protein
MALSGTHEQAPDGVLMIYGPSIRESVTLEHSTLLDIAPTVLHILGLPRAVDMSGKVLEQAFEPLWLDEFEPMLTSSYDSIDPRIKRQPLQTQISPLDETIKNELRSLGYID